MGTYHWIITLQFTTAQGLGIYTNDGVYDQRLGASRAEVYEGIRRDLAARDPRLVDANTLFFALEPNEL
ncbi:hypothetical protein ACMA1D_01990 [Streptomyces sp. 796.1]|uniref:hypothetical protein n=1 Tax=Streptomyces sp. 796.1 TaxID=3163029 RepID=UPI0039C9B7F0